MLVFPHDPVLDVVLPDADFSSTHRVWIGKDQASTWHVLLATRPLDLPVTTALLGLRALPALLLGQPLPSPAGSTRPNAGTLLRLPLLDALATAGIHPLAIDPPRSIAFGLAGRFWELGEVPPAPPTTLDAFRDAADDGLALAAIGIDVTGSNAGCFLSTETRIRVDDPVARERFARYWRVVGPGSALIRRELLRSVMRRAEGWRGFQRQSGWPDAIL